MKTDNFQLHHATASAFRFLVLASALIFASCDDDDPEREDTPEMITKVTLTFLPSGGGEAVVATASDPDGAGIKSIESDGPIVLAANTDYTLSIKLVNELEDPSDDDYDVTEEVEEDADEHMFFFSWTDGVFSDPSGDGNMDNRTDPVNYLDADINGLPLGLVTGWTTADAMSGTFRVVLKHQPDLKTDVSTAATGETDVDLTFSIDVE